MPFSHFSHSFELVDSDESRLKNMLLYCSWYGESSRAVGALTWELQGRLQPPERLPYIKIGDILYS